MKFCISLKEYLCEIIILKPSMTKFFLLRAEGKLFKNVVPSQSQKKTN